MKRALLALFAAAVLGALYAIASAMDFADALTDDALEKERRAMNTILSMPLDCDAWVVQSGPGTPPRAQCYVMRSKRWTN